MRQPHRLYPMSLYNTRPAKVNRQAVTIVVFDVDGLLCANWLLILTSPP